MLPVKGTVQELFALYDANQQQILEDYFRFLEFQSISSEPEYRQELEDCSAWLCNYLKDAGLAAETIETSEHPLVFAEWNGAGSDKPTVMFYGHYDVQPVDPLDLWESPPFTPTVRDGNVFARGAQDNKGQCFFFISAIKSLLKKHGSLPVNVKLCIEGDEEHGSQGLSELLHSIKDKLKCDHLVIVDVGLHNANKPSVTLGVRGILCMTVELEGSNTDLHSGTHGGLAYNPNHALVELLASLRDEQGKILVEGFYDAVLEPTDEELKQLNQDFDEADYTRVFGALPNGGESHLTPFESRCLRPTLEVNGIAGGYAGSGFKTVIPAKAQAKISARMVPNQIPEKIAALITAHLERNTPKGIKLTVTVHPGMGNPVRTSPECRVVQAAAQAFSDVMEKPCSQILAGASIPIVTDLTTASSSEVVLIGYGLPSDCIHAPNEHFGLDRFRLGFVTIGRLLDLLAE